MRKNNSTKLGIQKFSGPGYILEKMPRTILKDLLGQVEKIQKSFSKQDPFTHRLAGHLKYEFQILKPKPTFKKYLEKISKKYDTKFGPPFYSTSSYTYTGSTLARLWVNFQKKNEFNPAHIHAGTYSFVIWLKIPYDLKKELKTYKKVAGKPRNSAFEFFYTDPLGAVKIQSLYLDKKMEGVICFFPAKLSHSVNPFYSSDGFRISVAGNLMPK